MNKVEKDLNNKETQIELDKRSMNRDSILKARQNSMSNQKKKKKILNGLQNTVETFLLQGTFKKE